MAGRAWLGAIMLLLLCACGDDATQPDETSLTDLAGGWDVTQWEYSLPADPSQRADWVATMGLSGSLTISSNGAFSVTPRLPGGFGQDQGQLTLQGDSLYWDGEDDEEWVRFTVSGSALTLLWPEEELIDMNQDGQPEAVRLKVVLRRK